MKKIIYFLFLICFVVSCNNKKKFNKELSVELNRMVKIDQIVSGVPKGEYQKLSNEEWKAFKDSVYQVHEVKLKKFFNKYGYLGFDLVGKEGSYNFWLMVQHCDDNPKFQMRVLEKMKLELKKNNANPQNYGYLLDRVRINTGKPQIYGTQVEYNWKTCQAYPKSLKDSVNVNKRRKEIGLSRLEEYLNEMSKMHFEINQEIFKKVGITQPKLYE